MVVKGQRGISVRPLVYIAGPYGASKGQSTIDGNIVIQDEVARQIAVWGGAPIQPNKNTYGWQHYFNFADKDIFFSCDLSVLAHCDVLVYVEMATGVAAEIAFADALGIPVFNWAEEQEKVHYAVEHTITLGGVHE